MTHRPTASTELPTDYRSMEASDDSMEFAEFTGDDEDSGNELDSPAASNDEIVEKAARPAWFKAKTENTNEAESSGGSAPVIDTSETSTPEKATARRSRRRKRGSKDDRSKNDALIETEDEQPETLDWKKDWKKILVAWIVSTASCGYGVSLIFHTVVLLGMSAIVFHSMDNNEAISMIITDADAMPVVFTEIKPISVEPAGGSEQELPQFRKIPTTTGESEIPINPFDTLASNKGDDGEGGDTDEGFGFKFSMPEGGKAVSKGSFSAWTVPEDPEPGKDYMIVIRIRLPEKTRLYRLTDLSGKVEGSDTYVQHLPFDPNRRQLKPLSEIGGRLVELRSSSRLRVIKNHVQVMIPVLGGNTLVRDTIHVKSRMLKEDQKLEIVF